MVTYLEGFRIKSFNASQIRILNFFKVVMWFRKDYSFRFVIEHGELTFTSYFYFVRSGNINLNYSSMREPGSFGFDWARSATTYSSAIWARAHYLNFGGPDVGPSAGPVHRYRGHPVRCLVY